MYPPYAYPGPYPYEGDPWPQYGVDEAEAEYFVGAPPSQQGPGVVSSISTVAVVGLVVAGALGIYLIHEASKHAAPMQKKITNAAVKAIGAEAKRQGRVVGKRAGEAATDYATDYISRRLGPRTPKHINVEVLRTIK